MPKTAALLLALTLGAGACSTTEPPQTIVAVVPASDTDAAVADSPTTSSTTTDEAPESTESEAGTEPTETTTETTELAPTTEVAPSTTEAPTPSTTETPTTAPSTTAPTTTGALSEILSGSLSNDGQAISARFEGGIELAADIEGESFDMQIGLNGAFDSANESMEMTLDMSSLANLMAGEMTASEAEMFGDIFADPMQMRSIGNTAWIKWGLLDMFTGAEGKWLELEMEDADLSAAGSSPQDLVKMLNELGGEITTVGPDTIAGVATTHYSVKLDLNSMSGLMSGQDAADFEEVASMLGNVPIDIWVDGDKRLRRIEMSIDSNTFTDLLGPSESMDMSIWFQISEYGADVTITAPPASDVVSGDNLGLF